MSNSTKAKSAEEVLSYYTDLMKKISGFDRQISDLPDFFEFFSLEQKNNLFREFERVIQNTGTLSNWLSLPSSDKARFGISPNMQAMISQEEGSIIIKIIEIPKKV